jgi:hypothetical protein
MVAGKQTGLGDNFYIGGYDLSGDISAVDTISSPVGVLDVTTLTFKAPERKAGRRDGSMSFTTFLDVNDFVSTPGVPANNTPYVSLYDTTVHVTITGGTMTNVVINGTSVGSGAGTYTLPPRGTITLTYTSAPTWNWFTRGTEHNAISGLPSADVTCSYFQGTTVGNPAASMVSKLVKYDPSRDKDANLNIKVDAQSNGYSVEWGRQLTNGMRTDNGPTTGSYYDHGVPQGAYGCQGYFHLIELVGTNVTIAVQHCDTSVGSYTGLLTTGVLTAIGDKRVVTANNATVNRYLKVVTTGTFTQAVFGVNFIRNSVSGTRF